MSKKGKPTIYNLALAKNGQVDQINEISITSLFLKDGYTSIAGGTSEDSTDLKNEA